jgi:hypothetical protein
VPHSGSLSAVQVDAYVAGMSYSSNSAAGVPSSQVIYQQVVRAPSNGIAVAGLVLGIVAIALGVWMVIPVVGLFFAFVSFVPAVLGVIFGIVGLRQAARVGVGRGAALTGLVTGGLTLAIGLLTTMFWIFAIAASAASNSH